MARVDEIPELTVNWHLLEPCNFRCHYCFAKWTEARRSPVHDPTFCRRILHEIGRLAHRRVETADGHIGVGRVRLNFAGGEPFLVRTFGGLVAAAHAAGLGPSFISNGSLITNEFIARHAAQLSMAGFSFDAAEGVIMRKIGRSDARGQTLSPDRLSELVDRFREENPRIRIKINTVVCAENFDLDLRSVLARIRPDRWKVLRVLPVLGAMPISDAEFAVFLARHRGIEGMTVEDNNAMRGSYLMIDPTGRLFQNTEEGYRYSEAIPDVGIEAALRQVPFHPEKFQQRYA